MSRLISAAEKISGLSRRLARNIENALGVIDMVFKNEKVFDHRKFFKDKPSQWEELSSYALKRKEFILKQI